MRENFVQPLEIGFQANQEMQGRKTEREIQHEQFRKALRNLRMLCEIQKDSSCKTNLEHFLESIIYILYIFLKLRKSGVQRFKQCANRSWNEEVMAIWRQLHQAENEFRNLFSTLRNFLKSIYPLRNWRISQPLFSLAKFSQAHLPLAKLKNFATPFLSCEIVLCNLQIFVHRLS